MPIDFRIPRRRARGAWLAGMLIALLSPGAGAAPYDPQEAVAYALAHSPRLAAAREQAGAADARLRAVEGGRWPQLEARYLARRSDNALDAFADKLNTRSVDPAADFTADALNHPGASTLHNAGVVLEWPVYSGGRLNAGIREARRNREAADLGYERLRGVITFETLAAYRRAQTAQAAVGIADDAVRAAERHARTTARLLAENRIVASDKLTAEVNLALLRGQRSRAVSRRESAVTELKRVMGLALDAAVEIAPWSPAVPVPALGPLARYEERALANRRDLAAQRALLEAGRSQVDAARAATRPQVNVFAAENWYDDRLGLANSAFTVGASVRLSLYNGGRDREEIRAAQHAADVREHELRALELAVRQEVRDAYHAIEDARTRLAITGDNVDKAARTVALVRARYGEGRTILIDLLQSERLLVDARTERLLAALDLAIAAAALELAGGSLAPAE